VRTGPTPSRSARINHKLAGSIETFSRAFRGAVVAAPLALAGSAAGAPLGDAVTRGAYLAAAAGCDQCHTDSKNAGRAYAGGRIIETSLGSVVSPNITPDRETGIGRWQFADFARALRWGIAPDDTHYLPAFPFPFYNRLTDGDVADLKAFMETVPPVSQANRADESSLLLAARARAAIAVVAERFPGPWVPDPSTDATWNRGAYLVATVGRCGDCHTPRNFFGAPDPERPFAGSSAGPGGKLVPNITSDPATGIGWWSEEDIVNLLRDGQTPEFDFVGGAMAEIVHNTSRLDKADRHAIAVYLKSLRPIRSEKKGR
jgi:mono/diheme cytochrome c family protein